ncbi:alpha/beta hydrolase fold domain-containing protein [Halalkalicoccus ordinarius]|uniref:alpha/beta hydrolase fold domain-containing protein n=1 Tax=Halalkalicoccus ordinarius TaxID=3116651 RepID=UPI00300EFB2C
MGYIVKMPKLGLEMEQGTLLEWYVEEGETVEEGQTIAEVESEKSIGEIDAREDGVLRFIDLKEGATVPPGTPLAIVADAEEDITDLKAEFENEEATATTETETAGDETSGEPATSADGQADIEETESRTESSDVKASPRAKRRADELGVDITTIDGTGPQNAITVDDVEAAVDTTTTTADDTAAAELHPQVEDLLHELSEAGVPPLYRLPIEDARETYRELAVPEGKPEPVSRVIETEIDGPNGSIPIRIYVPTNGTDDTTDSQPTLAFFHGGGWIAGDLATYDLTCRVLANAADCIVASVAYRRAPENPFPAGLEDCYAATKWLAESPDLDEIAIDPNRLAIGGDSSGGTLAAGVALMARDRGGPPLTHQLLIYPATNHQFDTESYAENAKGYFITRNDMKRFWNDYLETPSDGRHPYASPLRTTTLADLPPATVLTAGFDPLRDEGQAYADRLEAAGVPVTRFEYEDMIHGFLMMLDDPNWDRAREAIDDLAGELRAAFNQ